MVRRHDVPLAQKELGAAGRELPAGFLLRLCVTLGHHYQLVGRKSVESQDIGAPALPHP